MSELNKVLAFAEAELGYVEKKSNSQLDSKTANAGNNNYTKYARDLDAISGFFNGKKNGYAWCSVFVSWCFVQAFGVTRAKELLCQPASNSLAASCKYASNYFNKKGQYFTTPKVGDQIFFKTSLTGSMCHTGLVYKVDDTYVYTIEGNTTDSEKVVSNGGCVVRKKYKLTHKQIAGYGRPNYKNEVKPKETEEFEMAKTYKNGSTPESVFAETTMKTKTGSLNAYETCECLAIVNGKYLIKYKVDGSDSYKCGFVAYHGGVK